MASTRRRGRRATGLALALAVAFPVVLRAGTPELTFERVGGETGPPSDVITAIFQDRTGFIWIGSRNGLTLYDGHTFRSFEHDAADPASISDHSIRAIYEDRNGKLWIGTNSGGLNRLDRATWTFEHFRHDSADPRSISHDSVYDIVEDRSGSLWVGTQVGLNRFDAETGAFERMLADPSNPASISNDYIMALHETRDGRLWVATLGGGINVRDPDTGAFTALRHDPDDPRTLSSDAVATLAEDPAGRMWVGTLDGLNELNSEDGSFRRFKSDPNDPGSLSDDLVTSLDVGATGNLWIGTHGGGLNELDVDTGTIRTWRHDPGRRSSLGDDRILKLLVDHTGAVWIGTWGGGLNRLTPTSAMLSVRPGGSRLPERLLGRDVTSLMHDDRGGMWVGTRNGDVWRIDTDGEDHKRYATGSPEGPGRIILDLTGRGDAVWIGTNGGLIRIDTSVDAVREFRHDPRDPNSLGPGYVRAILIDRDGQLWVGTGEGGVQRVDGDGRVETRFRHDPSDPTSLSDNYVTSIFETADGELWVGTRSGGLNRIDRRTGRATRYLPDPADDRAISHHSVTSLLEDRAGRLWVATSGGGVNRVDRASGEEPRFTWFTDRDGLADNDVMGILEDDDGSLWLSTKSGLSRFDPEGESFASIFVSDGLPTGEFESGAAARNGDTLYFGTVKGLVTFPVGTPFPPPEPSPMVVASVRTVSGEIEGDLPVWSLESLEVPWDEWLSFELAVLDYSPERRHRYAYRLGEEWVDIGSRREITFTDLKPGIHEFAAMGRNSQGVWSEATPPLRIKVVPPFWMTGRFRAGLALVVLALAILGHRVRVNSVEKRHRELVALHEQREKAREELARAYQRLRRLTRRLEAAKEDERRHIARELHDEMGPAMTAVIINLQLLAERGAGEDARHRIRDTISLVDRLVDRIRDLSLDLRPPLLDELGLLPALKGYLETQAERTGLDIEVLGEIGSEGLQPEIEITAFRVVQEAVTNVIRHAEAKSTTVTVRSDNGDLELRVTDDGHGFDVPTTMGGPPGKALGLLGMQERVGMLGGEVRIDSAVGRGTEVHVRMPVELQT